MPPADASVVQAVARLAAALAVTAAVLLLLYRRRATIGPMRSRAPFLQHLRELGSRVVRLALLVLFWTVLFTTLRFERFDLGPVPLAAPTWDLFDNAAARVYLALAATSLPEGVQVIVTRPTEAVAAQLQVAFLLGVLLTLPALTLEAWAFFEPGLEPRERRLLARALPFASLLFVAGAAFAYLVVVPLLFQILYAFAAPLGAATYLTAGALVGTLVTFALVFGLAFELPLAMAALVRFRFTRPETYLRYWRHATVVIFVLAALVTDPTLLSQVLVATVLLALYWGGVGLSFLARPEPTDAPDPRALHAPRPL